MKTFIKIDKSQSLLLSQEKGLLLFRLVVEKY